VTAPATSHRGGAAAGDDACLAAMWQEVLATGALPAAALPVRTRLVRAVGQVALPSGSAYLKVMSFPRAGDRLRYLLRALPSAHEAAMLLRARAAGIACPEVLAVRTARRGLLPFRSMLVLRALPVAADDAAPPQRLRQRAALARRLLDAGLFHPDLNADNFARLQDGGLAVLDLQSVRPVRARARAARRMAARLLLEAADVEPGDALAILADAGLAQSGDAGVERLAAATGRDWLVARVRRCWRTSTEFVAERRGLLRREHRRRGELPPGRWVTGADLARCWEGQRLLEVLEGRPPVLLGFRAGWPWLPGECSVYVPATVAEERVRDELRAMTEAHRRLAATLCGRTPPPLRTLQAWRRRFTTEAAR